MTKKSLSELAGAFYNNERPVGVIMDPSTVTEQAVNATRFYATFGSIESLLSTDALLGADNSDPANPIFNVNPVPAVDWITATTLVTAQEWGCIKSLFLLYVERENAILLESSRTMGVDVFGRSVSEIATEIAQAEADMPQLAFYQPIISV